MTQVTPLGFLRTRLDERLADLQDDYRAIYGEDIQIDADDIDGELLAIFAERISDIDQLAEDVYNSFNPQTSTGVALARLVQLNAIKKLAGAPSTVTLTLGGIVGTLIPAGQLVTSAADNSVWTTLQDGVIGVGGTVVVNAQCTVNGATTASIGSLTKITTPLYGWQTVTNTVAAVPGRLEETDEQLRIRRRLSTNTPAQSIRDAIYGAIRNLDGVRLASVLENATDSVDSNGQAAHSIYAIVEGGVAADIAKVIYTKKTAGTTALGAVATVVQDSEGKNHTINFDCPVYSDIYITVTVTKFSNYPADGTQQIKNALVAWALTGTTGEGNDSDGLGIGEDVVQTRLYSPVNTVQGHAINSITLGLAPTPLGTANIVVPYNGLARIDAARIVVVEL